MPDIDTPDDDAARIAKTQLQHQAHCLSALSRISLRPGSADRRFVVEMTRNTDRGIALTDAQDMSLLRLMWRERRKLPAYLCPKINPDDPLSPHFQGWRTAMVPAPSRSQRMMAGCINGR